MFAVSSVSVARSPALRAQRGQGLAEYVIGLVGIAIVALAIVVNYGGRIQGLFGTADDEVAALASGDYGSGTGTGDAGGPGPESQPPGAGNGDGAGADSDLGSSGFGSTSSGSSRGKTAKASSSAQASTRADRRGDGVVRPSRAPRRGQYTVGEGADRVTVVAPSRGRTTASAGRGRSVAGASSRQVEEARWDRKRRDAMEEAAPAEPLGGGKRVISFLGIVMFALLGLGLAVVGRFALGALGERRG